MAKIKISQLPELHSASVDTILVGNNNGNTFQIPLTVLTQSVVELLSQSLDTRLDFLETFETQFYIISASIDTKIAAATNEQSLAHLATTQSINTLSTSVNSRLHTLETAIDNDTMYLTTASADIRYVLSGSITQTTWDNIANKPAGIVSQSTDLSSLNSFTQSANNRLTNLETFSSSADSRYTLSGSIIIPSLNWNNINGKPSVISGSQQISDLGFVTGSYTTINSFNNLTQSFNTISQSFTTISGSFGDIDFSGINAITSSYLSFTHSYYSASASFDTRIKNATNEQYLEGYATTGSNTFNGNETISGSLFISGATELGGNIVPKTARGATLGTLERPFSDIFVSSGSINIASDTPGAPNTSLSNVSGNILISAGGMRLIGNASFIAATGSFGYISGSMTQVGDYTQTGNYTMVGDKTITGSLNVSGSIIGTDKIIIGNLNGDENNIVVAGTNYTTQVTIGAYGTDYVGQLMLHRHSTEIQPIIVAARSNSDSEIHGDITTGMALLQISATGLAGNDYKEFANIVFSADDLDGITIGDGSSPGKIDFNVTPDGDIHTNTALSLRSNLDAEFNGLVKSNGIILGADYPTTSKGKVGDLNGMIASDGNHIYYCYQDYSDGTNNIWKRVQLSNASGLFTPPAGVAIGNNAGESSQGEYGVAIGNGAGQLFQGTNAVAIGSAGYEDQGQYAIAIGSGAGDSGQGQYAIAIGAGAGANHQTANSIIIDGTNTIQQAAGAGLHIAPIRSGSTTSNVLNYNTTTKEITYITSSFETMGRNIISGSAQITAFGFVSGAYVSSSTYTTDSASFNSRIISGSAVAGTISSSAQISAFGFISSSAQLPSGIVSGSSQLTSSYDSRYVLSGSVSATGTTSTNFIRYTRSSQQTGLSNGSVVVCNVLENSSGTIISPNTSTGQITLTAGKTYRLKGMVPGFTTNAGAVRPQFCWYNETTAAYIGSSAESYAPGDAANYGAFGGAAEAIITPNATTIVSFRLLSGATGLAGIGGNTDFSTTGSYPWIDIEEIGSTFALNALNTMQISNNLAVTGSTTLRGAVNVGTGSGYEGGEIDLALAQTTSLTGSSVVFDVYGDKVRIFEGGGNSRGVSIDLSKAPNSVGGELVWKASGLVNAGTFVSLDNVKCTIPTSGNRSLVVTAVSTTFTANVSATFGYSASGGGLAYNNQSITTSTSLPIISWSFNTEGDGATYILNDKTNNRVYRITMMIGASFNNNFISIERLY